MGSENCKEMLVLLACLSLVMSSSTVMVDVDAALKLATDAVAESLKLRKTFYVHSSPLKELLAEKLLNSAKSIRKNVWTYRSSEAGAAHLLNEALSDASNAIKESMACQFIIAHNETAEMATPEEAALAERCLKEFLQSELVLLAPFVFADLLRRFDNFLGKCIHTRAEVEELQCILRTNIPILTEIYADSIRLYPVSEISSD